jgi:hypothetical protein
MTKNQEDRNFKKEQFPGPSLRLTPIQPLCSTHLYLCLQVKLKHHILSCREKEYINYF